MDGAASWASLMLRLASGLVFMAHGLPKLRREEPNPAIGRTRLRTAIEQMGFPRPVFWVYAVALTELLGGAMLVLGLFTLWVAMVLAVVMGTATCWMHSKFGFASGSDFPFALLFAMVALIFLGDGRFSLGALLGLN